MAASKSANLIDTDRLVKAFGGPLAMHETLAPLWPVDLSYPTVWSWSSRGVPPSVFVQLQILELRGDLEFDAGRYLRVLD